MLAAVSAAVRAAAGAAVLSLTAHDWERYCDHVERCQRPPSATSPPRRAIFVEQRLMYVRLS